MYTIWLFLDKRTDASDEDDGVKKSSGNNSILGTLIDFAKVKLIKSESDAAERMEVGQESNAVMPFI